MSTNDLLSQVRDYKVPLTWDKVGASASHRAKPPGTPAPSQGAQPSTQRPANAPRGAQGQPEIVLHARDVFSSNGHAEQHTPKIAQKRPSTPASTSVRPDAAASPTPETTADRYGIVSTTARELAQKTFPKTESILTGPDGLGLLEIGTARPHGLFGYAEAGKSTLGHQLAKCAAQGIPFLGMTTRKTSVLYYKTEDGERQVQRELERHGTGNIDTLRYLFAPEGVPLADALSIIVEHLKQHPDTGLVIVETLNTFSGVTKENDADQWQASMAAIKNVLCGGFPKVAFLFLAQFGKPPAGEKAISVFRIRGSSNIAAHCQDKLYLWEDPERAGQRIVKATSRGSGFRLEETYLEFDPRVLWSSLGKPVSESQKAEAAEKAESGKDAGLPLELLEDIQSIWPAGKEKAPTADLITRLKAIDGGRWNHCAPGGLNPDRMAKLLRSLGSDAPRPRTIRVGGETPKGYRRGDFDSIWERMCPQSQNQPATPATAATTQYPCGFQPFSDPATVAPSKEPATSVFVNKDAGCGGVAGSNGKNPESVDVSPMSDESVFDVEL